MQGGGELGGVVEGVGTKERGLRWGYDGSQLYREHCYGN